MKTSETTALIYAALAEAQGAFEAAIKDQENPAYRHNYADLTSHVEAARPHLRANKLGIMQDVVATTDGVSVTTRLFHASGEFVDFGPLDIPANKLDAQGLGSATSYARRYALSAALCTVADDDDAEGAVKTTTPRPAAVPAAPATVVDTATGEEVATTAGLPPAPEGYFYVTGYALTRGWHEATLLGWDATGGGLKVSTKTKTGEALKAAQDAGVPVKVKTRDKGKMGEAYLDACDLWQAKKAKTPPPAPSEMLTDSDIPF